MKKIIIFSISLALFFPYLNSISHREYYNSITKKTTLEEFLNIISSGDSYKLTGLNIKGENLATRIYRKRKDPESWLDALLPYALLNEIETQVSTTTGKRLSRFEKIVKNAKKEIEENGKLTLERLSEILYKTNGGRKSYFIYYITYLIENNIIKTPTLRSIITSYADIIANKIKWFELEDIIEILSKYPFLSILEYNGTNLLEFAKAQPIDDLIEKKELKKEIIKYITETQKDLYKLKAQLNFKYKDKNESLCSIF